MADYAEGPFERIVNVGWGGENYDFTTHFISEGFSQLIPYTDCGGGFQQLDLGSTMTYLVFELRALIVPPSLPSVSSGQVTATGLDPGDSLQLTWSGYSCTPQLVQMRLSEVTGSGFGVISGVSHSVTVRLFGATYWTGNRFRMLFIVTPNDAVYLDQFWTGGF